MTHAEGKILAEKVIAQLKPWVERGYVAGSFRRGKPEMKDLDIVVIPKRIELKDLYGDVVEKVPVQGFIDVIRSWKKIIGEPDGKYTRRIVDGQEVEISMCTPENWGNILMIRTGNSEFSHKMMKRALRLGFEQKEGYLYRDNKLIPVYEEKDYFDILNLPFIEPYQRDEHAFSTPR